MGRKPKDPNAPKKPRTNTKRDIGDPTFDLIRVFEQRSIGDMDDIELEKRITDLQTMRKMRFTLSKRKSALDMILDTIKDEAKAKEYLDKLEKQKT